jgi:hypothetical protein
VTDIVGARRPARWIAAPEHFAARFALLLLGITIAYAYAYYVNPWRPGAYPPNPDGWFVSWDQMNYRKSAQAFTELDFKNRRHFYPPLFPWLGAPFVRWIPNYTFLIPSLLCLFVYLYGVAKIGERYFGRVVTYGSLAVIFLLFPRLSIDQWVIPWTSSLVAALSSVLFLLFVRLATKPDPWAIETRADHAALYGFYLAYGAVFATRPLDVVILFPLAVIVAVGVLWRLGVTAKAVGICLGIGAAGWIFPAIFMSVNYASFDDPFGGYMAFARAGTSFVLGVETFERFVSLWIDADGIYPGSGPSLSRYFPLLIPALLLCIIAVFRAPFVVRVIAALTVLQITVYVTFDDLSPANLFASNLTHYFKWATPWLAMIAVWQCIAFIKARSWVPLAAVAVLSISISAIRLDVVPIEATPSQTGGTITVSTPHAQRIDVLDMPLSGGFPHGFSTHTITIDGNEIKRNPYMPGYTPNVKGLPMPWGTRLFFIRGAVAQQITVTFPPPFQLASSRTASFGRYRFTLLCLFPRCVAR